MNLTNLFNINFLKENIKRSKAVILLLTLLIPVINVIYYLMNSANTVILTPSIAELQPLSILGMYILPVILSITLFSFIYKRKSSDFVMSFPVSKKQIFISNTIGGIIIIIAMNLVNYLFTLIATLLLNNILIDYRMLFDMFILWTISYIFVFTCTNIAVSVSANKITTVVVTLLILFLVPFIHTFIVSDEFKGISNPEIETYCGNEACKPNNYKCYSTSCEIKKRQNIYPYTYYEKVEENANYTMPYALIHQSIIGEDSPNVNKSILKMALLSIIYIFIGLFLFLKKKFEVVETSFKSEKTHIFVRSLTTTPIICIYYIILSNSNITFSDIFTITFLIVLLIAYLIIYDLLTRKRVTNILKALAALIIVGIIVIFTGKISSSKNIEQINVNQINKMTILDNTMVNKKGYTNNKDLINYIMSIHIDNIKGEENYYKNFNIRININKKIYEFTISTTKEQYNHILNTLSNDQTYQKSSIKIKNKDVFAIQLEDGSYLNKEELYDNIIEELKNSRTIENENINSLFNVVISTYNNYEVNKLFYTVSDKKLQEEILNHYNGEVKKVFSNPNVKIYSYSFEKYDEVTGVVEEPITSYYYFSEENIDINNFILDNLNHKVDITKPYTYIRFYTNDFYKGNNIFITNKIVELEKLLKEIKQKEEKIDVGDTNDKYTY